MSIKVLFGLLMLAVLAWAGWYYRENPDLRRWLHLQQQAMRPMPFNGAAQSGAAPDAAAAGLHKCRRGAQVVYTDTACPKDSVEQPISGGAVTVVPGQAAAPAAKPEGPPENANLRDRAMEKIINK